MAMPGEEDLQPPSGTALSGATTVMGALIGLGGIAWGADLYRMVGWNFLAEQFLAVVLGLAMGIIFLIKPLISSSGPTRASAPWYDWVLSLGSVALGVYLSWYYPRMLGEFFNSPMDVVVCCSLLFVLVIEGLRRASGWALVIVVLVFFAYALAGHKVGGALQTREVNLSGLLVYLGLDSSGLFGLVLLIGVTVVIPFVFFGQLLASSGGANFFNDISIGLMGRFRGGAAKISILASSLFGSINGIVVSNILATGVVTIPMMKRSGFKPEQAAAVEATASNGGQMMPPVMGAVAFLITLSRASYSRRASNHISCAEVCNSPLPVRVASAILSLANTILLYLSVFAAFRRARSLP